MQVDTRKESSISIVAIKGRMDAVTTPEIESKLTQLVNGGEKKLLVNLNDLEYISSAGLRALLATAKRLKSEQGDIAFTNLGGHVKEVFEISGFYSIFKVFESTEAALEQFGK
ncbi:MAG: putative anti-sigma factor antagonist BtrV [Syntrophorhabdaceae bacterium PtaU1.Bin034]|jgi:anti-anti-sigma factor|nr:MAG: putative anti-sigma factor antagonist BtrV [Syntrophorhabdaceae bacterium PtaU1.Bin034]